MQVRGASVTTPAFPSRFELSPTVYTTTTMALPLLSNQTLPPGGPQFSVANINEYFSLPPISPSIADNNRRFYPPCARTDTHPTQLFTVRYNGCTVPGYRFIRTTNPKQMLMFIDGACSNNGTPEARGGCGVVYSSTHWAKGISHPLEIDGTPHTSNRAELRAAILALGLRVWYGEGFDSVVLACDSEYVVKGVTERLNVWAQNGWETARGTDVKNKDYWQALLNAMRELESHRVLVQFWQIPRLWNEADEYAKKAVTDEREGSRGPISDVLLVERM
ncbi:ribonuclease H-like domain-containing protein [Trichophaea hybrida]|nr:ribonuclease H-like domain-containing protein [Trichophaea hybrida]